MTALLCLDTRSSLPYSFLTLPLPHPRVCVVRLHSMRRHHTVWASDRTRLAVSLCTTYQFPKQHVNGPVTVDDLVKSPGSAIGARVEGPARLATQEMRPVNGRARV